MLGNRHEETSGKPCCLRIQRKREVKNTRRVPSESNRMIHAQEGYTRSTVVRQTLYFLRGFPARDLPSNVSARFSLESA